MRKSYFNFYLGEVVSPSGNTLTLKEKTDIAHYEYSPILYKYSDSSYFSEAEYTLSPGQWIERFWEAKDYKFLVGVKKQTDPDIRFACRHCVGDMQGDNLGN